MLVELLVVHSPFHCSFDQLEQFVYARNAEYPPKYIFFYSNSPLASFSLKQQAEEETRLKEGRENSKKSIWSSISSRLLR